MKRHVALVGFMAAGKSTVGALLAKQLRCAFHDIDAMVERERGPIVEIFMKQGEATFRGYESEALRAALSSPSPAIVAVGGGALVARGNAELLRHLAHRVFLRVSPKVAHRRLMRGGTPRPVFRDAPTLRSVELLYAQRIAGYASAEHVIDVDSMTRASVAAAIAGWIGRQHIEI